MNDDGRAGLCPAQDFPGTRDAVYLNAAGIGLTPAPVARRTADLLTRLAVHGTGAYWDVAEDIRMSPRVAAAELYGCDVDDVAVVGSTAEAISQFAWWVSPRAGQNVVVVDIDHPSAIYPWLRVAQDSGAEVRFVKVADDVQSLSTARIADLVDQNTAAISVSHVLWTTGYRFDLKALAALAHSVGGYLCVDATQSAGVVPIDVKATGVDFISASSFKWLLAQAGTAICYMRPELAERMTPILVGNKSTANVADLRPSGYDTSRMQFPEGASRLEFGSSGHLARYTLGASLRYLNALGVGAVAAHVEGLCDRLYAGLMDLGAEILTPAAPEHRAGVMTARFADFDGDRLTGLLEDRDVIVMPRLGGVRFSPHAYNSAHEIDRALDVLSSIVRG